MEPVNGVEDPVEIVVRVVWPWFDRLLGVAGSGLGCGHCGCRRLHGLLSLLGLHGLGHGLATGVGADGGGNGGSYMVLFVLVKRNNVASKVGRSFNIWNNKFD